MTTNRDKTTKYKLEYQIKCLLAFYSQSFNQIFFRFYILLQLLIDRTYQFENILGNMKKIIRKHNFKWNKAIYFYFIYLRHNYYFKPISIGIYNYTINAFIREFLLIYKTDRITDIYLLLFIFLVYMLSQFVLK